MPSPIGHALGGLIVSLVVSVRPVGRDAAPAEPAHSSVGPLDHPLALGMVAACLPDLDFLWGRHNMETHSLGFAALVGVLGWLWAARRGQSGWSAARVAAVCALAVGSHVLFDWLGSDDSPPLGVMALWPVSDAFYFGEAFVFEAISRRYWLAGFVQHNLLAIAREVLILGPAATVVWWIRSRRGPTG